jgi:hypothetical protein
MGCCKIDRSRRFLKLEISVPRLLVFPFRPATFGLKPPLCLVAILLIQSCGVIPANSFHEDIDAARGRGSVVHVIGMLVHIEHQNRTTARGLPSLLAGIGQGKEQAVCVARIIGIENVETCSNLNRGRRS